MGFLSKLLGTDFEEQKRLKFAELEKLYASSDLKYAKAAWLTTRGKNNLPLGRTEQSIIDFNEAIKIDDRHVMAFRGLSLGYCSQHDPNEAIKILHLALGVGERSFEFTILYHMIPIYIVLDDVPNALDVTEKALLAYDFPERVEAQRLIKMSRYSDCNADDEHIKEVRALVKWLKELESCRKLSLQGDTNALYKLGCAYAEGRIVLQNLTKAMELWRKAAEQGNASAQFNLGTLYNSGRGVEKDYAKAVEWFQKAAIQGDAGAQYTLGLQYTIGHGVQLDWVIAATWLNLAAIQRGEYQNDAIKSYNIAKNKLRLEELQEVEFLSSSWKVGEIIKRTNK